MRLNLWTVGTCGFLFFVGTKSFIYFAGSVSIFGTCFETEIGGNVKAAAIKGEDKNDG